MSRVRWYSNCFGQNEDVLHGKIIIELYREAKNSQGHEGVQDRQGPHARASKKGTKEGDLKSGSGGKVKSRKQAVAIALSEARRAGARVPRKKAS